MEGTRPGYFYFASESVGEGHPDKLCDQISDGVLDACIKQAPHCKVGLESATKTKMVNGSFWLSFSVRPLLLAPASTTNRSLERLPSRLVTTRKIRALTTRP